MTTAPKKTAPKKTATKKTATKKTATKKTATKKTATKKTATKKTATKKTATKQAAITTTSASQSIDARIGELGGWRAETLARVRALIHDAVPDIVETWKWMGTPVFEHHGIVCTGEAYKSVVKLTFAKGASVPDPKRLFNSSLDGNTRRAIDIREGEIVDAEAFKTLVRAAATLNGLKKKKR